MKLTGSIRRRLAVVGTTFCILLMTGATPVFGNVPPILQVPDDSLVTLCSADSICFEVTGSDADEGDTVTLSLLEGPVSFTPISGSGIVIANVCFLADVDGLYRFVWQVEDLSGATAIDTVIFTVATAAGISIPDQTFSGRLCDLRDNRILPLVTEPPDLPDVWFELITGSGSIDSVSGVLIYQPDTSGIHQFTVAVHNQCGSDTGLISDSLFLNSPGLIQPYDTVVYLCQQETVCFGVYGYDADDDSLVITQLEGLGEFTMNSDTSGLTCFLPADMDSAAYLFIYRAADSCTLGGGQGDPSRLAVQDTITVTVIIDQVPEIICPASVSFFTCDSGSFSFAIDAFDPEGGPITFNLLSGNASLVGNSITVFGDQSMQFEVRCEAVDTCGHADTCSIEVEIIRNSPPIISINDGYDVNLCAEQTLCIGASMFDPDNNIALDSLSYGQYDDQSGQICFLADSSGSYEIIWWAEDSCGLQHADTSTVTVHINEPPTIDLGPDFSTTVCAGSQICFGVDVVDEQSPQVSLDGGAYFDPATSQVCFSPDSAGTYRLIAMVRDDCGELDYDTVVVTVTYLAQPTISILSDSEQFVCTVADNVCLDVSVVASGQYTVSSSIGTYDAQNGQVCFVPDTAGSFDLVVLVTDSCGFEAADSMVVVVWANSPPTVQGLSDTAVYLCSPRQICLAVSVADIDNNLAEVTVSRGQYSDGQVCFVPYSQGAYEIVVTATDSCGRTAVDTAVVTVLTDQSVSLECPGDTTVFACGIEDIFSFAIGGIPSGAQVSVSGINVWWDAPSQSVQFAAECSNINNITVTATTECGSYSCQFAVTVNCNQHPLVLLPGDTTIVLCVPGQLCIPVGVSDVDGNLDTVYSNLGTYSAAHGTVCFEAGSTGVYQIEVTAVDSCGLASSDVIEVSVIINSAPQVAFGPTDTLFSQCLPEQICLPLVIDDAEGNIVSITAGEGFEYNASDSTVCFFPDQLGQYCATIVVRDSCGLSDTVTLCVTVEEGDFVQFTCPNQVFLADSLCRADTICVPLDITGDNVVVTTAYGFYSSGNLCFLADTTGLYSIEVIATAQCNADTCLVEVEVFVADSVEISCVSDTTEFLCGPATLCYPFTVSSSVQSVSVELPAYISGDTVCLPVDASGSYEIVLTADGGECGIAICTFTVDVNINSAPGLSIQDTYTATVCSLQTVCIPISAVDIDGNIDSLFSTSGSIVFGEDTSLCFTPVYYDTVYTVEVGVLDECGEIAFDTVSISLHLGPSAFIFCPGDTWYETICGAATVCIRTLITPFEAIVTVSHGGYYDPDSGLVCVPVDSAGTYDIVVIAEAMCSTDTCLITLIVEEAEAPDVVSPARIDTTFCLNGTEDTLCFAVDVIGSGVQVNVNPIGYYSAGFVCLPVDTAGSYELEIVAFGVCGSDTGYTTVSVGADEAPQLSLPADTLILRCPDDTGLICIDGIFAADDGTIVSPTMVCGLGSFELVSVDSGRVCFRPGPGDFGIHEFCFVTSDSCQSDSGSFFVEILQKDDCDVCVRITIDGGESTPVGVIKDVDINVETNDAIGGFDLLIGYDASVLSFQSASIEGTDIDGWEYFSYRIDDYGCGSACPSGIVRLIGIADINNGIPHPPDSTLTPNGQLVGMRFLVANDQNLGDQFLPIGLVWFDCGDNAFSDLSGNLLFVDSRIYNSEGFLIWDEFDDAAYPDSTRPFLMGAPDSCIDGGSTADPIRCVEFYNGGIHVIHPDSIDARGDVNLNGIAYEIADAVVFSNYFIYGLSAFTVNVQGQIAATDVNGDGITLSVADLIYLIRVVSGDIGGSPRLIPYAEELIVESEASPGGISLLTESGSDIGGALFVYDITGDVQVRAVRLVEGGEQMSLLWGVVDGQLRMLMYSLKKGRVSPGRNNLIEISYGGSGKLALVSSEVVDYFGRPYRTANRSGLLPNQFSLEQNYPNPFNPTTNISFSLPAATNWSLMIYNVTGALVRQYGGSDEAGEVSLVWDGRNAQNLPVASGIYFYRLHAGDFSDTRKMVLLK